MKTCQFTLLAYWLTSAMIAQADYIVEPIVTGLNQPMYVTQAPGDNSSLYIVERQGPSGGAGRILRHNLVTHTSEVFLDFAGNSFTGDGGVLCLAFHPQFESNGKFYVTTSFNGGVNNLRNRVQEFRVGAGVPTLERTLLEYDNLLNPFHTVNWVGFDPTATGDAADYLWITLGDGGTQAQQPGFVNHSQDLSQVYGKILRIDVRDGFDAYPADPKKNFAVPATNRYANDGDPSTLAEIYASGFREPFRVNFDRETGDLYIGDVGHMTREEINFLRAGTSGVDFGWASREGTEATPVTGVGGPLGDSINPIYELDHSTDGAIAMTGGLMYRGPIPELQGRYFFGDFANGHLFSATFDRTISESQFDGANLADVQEVRDELESRVPGGANLNFITAFTEDHDGNMYLVKFGDAFFPPNGEGAIYRVALGQLDFPRGDFNLDGTLDRLDWKIFAENSYVDLSGLTQEEAYLHGDMDGDGDNDSDDFRLFQTEYQRHQLADAYQIPEPAAVELLLLAIALRMMATRRGTKQREM